MTRKRPASRTIARVVRCAIYTRKSTEEGLEQEYNSLDAQYDACSAYIASQRHEGWIMQPERYDDGGFSGGNMERPGLKRLLADIEAGKVDVIIVYKVDRLTRSLADFAKIVELLDSRSASFVSVTQSFNTTTSMGRLTLNVLLSFAQFEREVTGERIRDKIAASKKKGLWMGGPVPLGYQVVERKLVVVDTEAALVRQIYQRYLDAASVDQLASDLNAQGYRTKIQHRSSGPHRGGCMFRRGTLYHLLSNRIYLGKIVHKGEAYEGEHEPIVSQDLFDAVQDRLAARGPGAIDKQRLTISAAFAGLLYDGLGRVMTSNQAVKGSKRYRYYATREASDEQPAWRVSAHDLERIVREQVQASLRDRNRLARMVAAVDPRSVQTVINDAATLASSGRIREMAIERIDLQEDHLTIRIDEVRLLRILGLNATSQERASIILSAPIAKVRRGHELRLVIPSDAEAEAQPRNDKLVRLMADALAARAMVLAAPDQTLQQIAQAHGRCRKRLTNLLRISWLAPQVVQSIMDGTQPAELTAARLLDADLPLAWDEHAAAIG